jgi:hypothetical protein
MMKSKIVSTGAGILVIFFGLSHSASAQQTATSGATATIVQGAAVTKNTNLRFGALIPGILGGTVTVNTAGLRAYLGTMTFLSSVTAPFSAANFSVLGQPNQLFSVALPLTATLTRQGGTETILLTTIVANPLLFATLDAAGNGTMSVGGTIVVAAGQAPGYYVGSFTVIVNYQ